MTTLLHTRISPPLSVDGEGRRGRGSWGKANSLSVKTDTRYSTEVELKTEN
jgi:hypothetical protein